MIMKTFGDRLRKLRKINKYSQKELGEIFGLSESAISMYERNERSPSYEIVKKMAIYFNVHPEYLYEGKVSVLNNESSNNDPVKLSPDDIKILEEIKKHPVLFHDLASAPEKKIKQLIKMWEFIKKDLDDDSDEDDDIIED